jgi:hypothetical protein
MDGSRRTSRNRFWRNEDVAARHDSAPEQVVVRRAERDAEGELRIGRRGIVGAEAVQEAPRLPLRHRDEDGPLPRVGIGGKGLNVGARKDAERRETPLHLERLRQAERLPLQAPELALDDGKARFPVPADDRLAEEDPFPLEDREADLGAGRRRIAAGDELCRAVHPGVRESLLLVPAAEGRHVGVQPFLRERAARRRGEAREKLRLRELRVSGERPRRHGEARSFGDMERHVEREGPLSGGDLGRGDLCVAVAADEVDAEDRVGVRGEVRLDEASAREEGRGARLHRVPDRPGLDRLRPVDGDTPDGIPVPLVDDEGDDLFVPLRLEGNLHLRLRVALLLVRLEKALPEPQDRLLIRQVEPPPGRVRVLLHVGDGRAGHFQDDERTDKDVVPGRGLPRLRFVGDPVPAHLGPAVAALAEKRLVALAVGPRPRFLEALPRFLLRHLEEPAFGDGSGAGKELGRRGHGRRSGLDLDAQIDVILPRISRDIEGGLRLEPAPRLQMAPNRLFQRLGGVGRPEIAHGVGDGVPQPPLLRDPGSDDLERPDPGRGHEADEDEHAVRARRGLDGEVEKETAGEEIAKGSANGGLRQRLAGAEIRQASPGVGLRRGIPLEGQRGDPPSVQLVPARGGGGSREGEDHGERHGDREHAGKAASHRSVFRKINSTE